MHFVRIAIFTAGQSRIFILDAYAYILQNNIFQVALAHCCVVVVLVLRDGVYTSFIYTVSLIYYSPQSVVQRGD